MKSQKNIMKADFEYTMESALAAESVDKLKNTYLHWIERALQTISDSSVWDKPNSSVNSIGNLLLHLEGNVRQWIIHGLGGEKDNRERDKEFSALDGASAIELLNNLKQTVDTACNIISEYDSSEKLMKELVIQGFTTNAYAAIFHVVEHFSYHTGQIVWITKEKTDKDLKFYEL